MEQTPTGRTATTRHRLNRKGLFLAIAGIGAIVMWPALAWAHARLVRSEPAADTTLVTPPAEIQLWFTEAPELAVSLVAVVGDSGPVRLGALERGDSKLSLRTRVLGRMPPGRYTAEWRVMGADGHPSSGFMHFVVAPSRGPYAAAPPAAIATGPEPTAPLPATRSATVPWLGLATVIIVLVVVIGVLLRPRPAADARRPE